MLFRSYQINIIDDGVGFCPLDKKGTGNGHFNMKKRADAIRAQINIDSLPEKGTNIILKGKIYS